MTDSTLPDGSTPSPGKPEREPADETKQTDETTQADDRTVDPTTTGDDSAAPLTESTDGGLEGGDPGVEE